MHVGLTHPRGRMLTTPSSTADIIADAGPDVNLPQNYFSSVILVHAERTQHDAGNPAERNGDAENEPGDISPF